jgi:hypothetical protein
MTQTIELQVIVNPDLTGVVDANAVCFETGLTRKQAADPELYAYEHHGAEFSAIDPGSLSMFFEDVILGRPMPAKFITRALNIDTLFAITLFLHRDLATHPALPGLFASVDLAHRRGFQGFGHLDPDLTQFLLILGSMFPKDLSQREHAAKMKAAIGWIHEYITQGTVPQAGLKLPEVKIIDTGTRGFVLAESKGPLLLAWIDLFRQGYLMGVLVGVENEGRRGVIATRKSVFVDFNLLKAASLLNEIESRLGQTSGWKADELWLQSPDDGTCIPVPGLVEVFLRV